MPVHLFGRPAPIDELRRFGLPIDRGRGAGLRRARDRDERRLDVQLLPDEEPLRARRRRPDRGERRRARRADPACCASTARARRRSSSTSATTRGSTRSRPRCCAIFLPHLDGWNAARREAAARYAELGARRDRRAAAATSRATSTTCTASARPSATALAAALAEAGIGFASYYEPPLHLQPALRYLGYSEGDLPETEKAARENLCLPLWAGISEEQQAEVVVARRCARAGRRASSTGA